MSEWLPELPRNGHDLSSTPFTPSCWCYRPSNDLVPRIQHQTEMPPDQKEFPQLSVSSTPSGSRNATTASGDLLRRRLQWRPGRSPNPKCHCHRRLARGRSGINSLRRGAIMAPLCYVRCWPQQMRSWTTLCWSASGAKCRVLTRSQSYSVHSLTPSKR